REPDGIGQDAVIAELHVVGDVDVHHQQVIRAEARDHASALGSSMDADELADAIAVANDGLGWLAVILQVLRSEPDARVWIERVVAADGEGAFAADVREQACTGTDAHVRTDHTERSYFSRGIDFRI